MNCCSLVCIVQSAKSMRVLHFRCFHYIFNAYVTLVPITNSVRLTGSTTSSSGVVEVYLASSASWVTICPSEWDDADAGVVCRALGYDGGATSTFATSL